MRMLAMQWAGSVRQSLKATFLHRARLRRDAPSSAMRHDAPRPRTVARRELRKTVTPIAKDLAQQTHAQVMQAIGVSPTEIEINLDEHAYGFVDSMVSILEDYPIEATQKVASAFEEWSSVAEEDRNADALATLIDSALDGEEGKLLNSLRMLYGSTFADMNKAVQVEAGVPGYFWLCTHDAALRTSHAACENVDDSTPYDNDETPLSAAASSNGEACAPGDDYNCRCIRVPAVDADAQPPDVLTDL